MNNFMQKLSLALTTILSYSIISMSGASAWVDTNNAVTIFGGSSNEETLSIAVDSNGNIYSSGFFNGVADFNPGAGTESLTSLGSLDAFVSKLDSSGNFLWAIRLGNSGGDVAKSISVDESGNVLIAGDFSGTVDFDPGAGTANLTSFGQGDIFIAKFDTNGNFIWAKSMGGSSADSGIFVAVDRLGNSAITGIFSGSVDFDPGLETTTLTSAGDWDIYVSKFDSNGNFLWSKRRGGTGRDIGDGIGFDSAGNLYSSGIFSGAVDFDPGLETSTLTSSGSNDVFISKFDTSGNYLWAKKFGGSSSDGSTPISVDSSGNIYLSGDFSGTVDFDPTDGVLNLTAAGTKDNFISKVDSSGNYLWTKRIGSSGAEATGARTAIDSSGNVFYTGDFTGTVDFDPGVDTSTLTSSGLNDIFISKIDSSGNFLWTKAMGSSGADRGQAIAVDKSGNVYATGYFNGTADFDPSATLLNLTSSGGRDVFISKFNPAGSALISSMVPTPGEIAAKAAATRAAAEAAVNAAKAAAEAAEVKREAEKKSARADIATSVKSAKELTVESFSKAEIPGINASNIDAVKAELSALPEESKNDFNQILKVARKYEVLGIIGSGQVKSIQANTFVEIGLIPETSKNKVALSTAVKNLPAEARDSLVEIKAAIEAETKKIEARKDRVASLRARSAIRTIR
jgi:hypothetical protein